MNINKNNYEAYFLDYHEGNLSPQEVADLFLFLSHHPELKKELDDFENVSINDFSNPIFENKDSLKKNITPDNREDYFIRAVEGTLDASELLLLQNFLTTHPEFVKEFQLFEKTKLQADPTLIFENKNELKQLAEIDYKLISSVEGLLTKKEQAQLEQELTSNAEFKKAHQLYLQTKLTADPSVVFTDKNALKRKGGKVIPLFYYTSAAAASVAILLGLFFMFKTTTHFDEQVAQQKNTPVVQPTIITRNEQSFATNSVIPTTPTKKSNKQVAKKIQQPATVTTQQPTEVLKTNEDIAVSTPLVSDPNPVIQPLVTPVDSNIPEQTKKIEPVIAQNEKKPQQPKAPEFASVRDVFTGKLKEKLIGKDAVSEEAPAKISGWDVAGVFAKGLSNLTGKKIALKPKFNKQGEVTAYAFSAGKMEFSRVK